jgi:hypothetical protein
MTPHLSCAQLGRMIALLLACAPAVATPAAIGCSGDSTERPGASRLGDPGAIRDGRVGIAPMIQSCAPDCTDFPEQPIFDSAAGNAPPPNAASLFGSPDSMGASGACLLEPQLSEGKQPGALFPRNWLRPRFRWQPLAGEDLWEIRLSAEEQKRPLIVYTKRTSWALPRELWRPLADHNLGAPVTVTIRGISSSARGKPSGTRGTFGIAPAEASGKLVYWATTSSEVRPDTSKLVGFGVGDEGVIDALRVPQVSGRSILNEGGRQLRGMSDDPRGVAAGQVQCIGCHVSTPDGEAVAFTDHWPWDAVIASVQASDAGRAPSYLTPGAQRLLSQPWLGMTTVSEGHWRAGDRLLVAAYSPRNLGKAGVGFSDGAPYPSHSDGLAWFDLETTATFTTDQTRGDVQQQLNDQIAAQLGTSFGLIELIGESRSAVAPSFSHDGKQIVYTSADSTQDGRIGPNNQEVDLHVVPFNERRGGAVRPLMGAAEPKVAEYYPAFSRDDRLVAFTRVATLDGGAIYYRPDGEVYVVPSNGGEAERLRANDPPACSGQKSPGVINSWPKWSPAVTFIPPVGAEFDTAHTYYWVIFSSARAYEGQFMLPKSQSSANDARSSQLYMAAIVVNEDDGSIETFPAVYLWNQDPKTSNLTPAWDDFKIPPVPGPD